MSVKLNLGAWNSVFAVPSKIVDEDLKLLDGVKLKVLLYVLRNSDKELSNEMISKATGVSKTDVPEALDFWVSFGVLSKNDSDYGIAHTSSGSTYADISAPSAEKPSAFGTDISPKAADNPEKPDVSPSQSRERFTVTRPKKPDYVFTAQRLAVDEELAILVNEAQSAFGRVLSNSDISTLLMLKDTCGLPLDVITMLIQYCISIGKGNIRAVEKIGIKWADDGIYSVEAADNKIMQTRRTSKNFAEVSAAFGLKNAGSPTQKQLEYGDKWVGDWKFSHEMLREAYERCVDRKGQLDFRYIDGILKRWYAQGIANLNDLATAEKLTAKKKGASYDNGSSSIDYSKLDKLSIPDV